VLDEGAVLTSAEKQRVVGAADDVVGQPEGRGEGVDLEEHDAYPAAGHRLDP
jgi:hypothetical protein